MRGLGGDTDVREQMELFNSLFNYILSQESNQKNENSSSDTLTLQHLAILANMIGASLDDSSLYRLAWGWSCKKPLSITRQEFVNGMQLVCSSNVRGSSESIPTRERLAQNIEPKFEPYLAALRSFIEQKDKQLHSSYAEFRSFYRFVFEWVRAPETTARSKAEIGMSIETAVELWRMFIPEYKSFSRMEEWCTFCTTESLFRREAVSRDLWEQFLEFTSLTQYDTYDVNDAWPSAIDDFVEWCKTKVKD